MSRRKNGYCITEVLVGSVVLIALGWFGIDAATIVLANSANDSLAKNAARAAANQDDKMKAADAATKCINNFSKSGIITNVVMEGDIGWQDKKQVTVKTEMMVKLPVSFPGLETIHFHAQAAEPIVGVPADV